MARTGVLLLGFGGPDSIESVAGLSATPSW